MVTVINKPHEESKNHDVFEFNDIFGIKDPGEKAGCENREPGYGVEGDGSDGKTNGKSDEKKLERNGDFEFEENKVTKNAYNSCNNSAHSPKEIMGDTHKDELDTLNSEDFAFAFDKTGKHHYGAGND